MPYEPKYPPRPQLPRAFLQQVVDRAKELGEEFADQSSTMIIKMILRRYVDGESLSPKGRVNAKPVSERARAPVVATPTRGAAPKTTGNTRALLIENLFQVLVRSVQDDGLTRPMGGKVLARSIKTSQGYAVELLETLIKAGRIIEVEQHVGTRGPRYRIVAAESTT